MSDLYSCVRDESDVLFSVYLNSENKKYTASRDSECFTSLIVDENVVPKGNIRHDQTMVCQGLFQGVSKHGPNTKAARNTSANLAGNKSHQRNAKFRRETGDTGSADDAERGTHTRSQTPTRNAKGHQVHLQRVNGNAADGKFRGDLPRKHTAADNARDGVEARQSTDELMRASQGRKAQRDGTANYAYQTGDSGDGQTVDNHVNSTVSSRRRQTRQTDNDTSNARDANRAKLLTDTTCQVVTRNATRAEARKAELERTNACELAADEKQITDAQINILSAGADTRSELMRSPNGATGNVTDETEVIRRDRKQIRRTSEPSQKAETQTVRPIEQWRTKDANNIGLIKHIDSNAVEANVDTDDLFDMRMQREKRARTERDSNERRVINYERTKNNRDIYSSDVTEKSACKLNETNTTDCSETGKTVADEKKSFREITENKDACDKDRSENRRLYKHELGGVYSRNMYGGDERQKPKHNVGLPRLSINTKILPCKMRITQLVKRTIIVRSMGTSLGFPLPGTLMLQPLLLPYFPELFISLPFLPC